jgi:hypothetical protein
MGGSSEKAASVGSKLKKCLRRIVTAMSRDLRPQDLQRSSIRQVGPQLGEYGAASGSYTVVFRLTVIPVELDAAVYALQVDGQDT